MVAKPVAEAAFGVRLLERPIPKARAVGEWLGASSTVLDRLQVGGLGSRDVLGRVGAGRGRLCV